MELSNLPSYANLERWPPEVRPFAEAFFESLEASKEPVIRHAKLRNQLESDLRQRDLGEPKSDAELDLLRRELDAAEKVAEEAQAAVKHAEKLLIERAREHRIRCVPLSRRGEALQLLEEERLEIQAVQDALEPFYLAARGDKERLMTLLVERERVVSEIEAGYDRRLEALGDRLQVHSRGQAS